MSYEDGDGYDADAQSTESQDEEVWITIEGSLGEEDGSVSLDELIADGLELPDDVGSTDANVA